MGQYFVEKYKGQFELFYKRWKIRLHLKILLLLLLKKVSNAKLGQSD